MSECCFLHLFETSEGTDVHANPSLFEQQLQQQLGFILKQLEETNSLDTHALETAWSYVCLDPDRTEKEPCQTR